MMGSFAVEAAFPRRRSIRNYNEEPLDLKEISQLLWAAQGIIRPGGYRTCPSAGALYPLEIQLVAGRVDGLLCGSYSYDCANHAILYKNEKDIRHDLAVAALWQFKFQAPVLMGGNKDEARALADKITALNASEGYLARASLAELEKNPVQVEAYYLKAVQADPKNYNALTTLGAFYSQPPHQKYGEATKHAQNALQLDPNRVGAHWILARVFVLQERWGDLEQILTTWGKMFPMTRARFSKPLDPYWKSAKTFRAPRATPKKYLSQEPEGEEPDAAAGHRLLGLVFEKEDETAEARAEIQTALSSGPTTKPRRMI